MNKDDARDFARQVLSMPEDAAARFLEEYHAKTCHCGQQEDGRELLEAVRMKWAHP